MIKDHETINSMAGKLNGQRFDLKCLILCKKGTFKLIKILSIVIQILSMTVVKKDGNTFVYPAHGRMSWLEGILPIIFTTVSYSTTANSGCRDQVHTNLIANLIDLPLGLLELCGLRVHTEKKPNQAKHFSFWLFSFALKWKSLMTSITLL